MQVTSRRIAPGIALTMLLLSTLGADSKNRVWQYGEIICIKEDLFSDGDSTAYVYSLRGKDVTYVAAFASPLKAPIHSTVKFSVDKKSLCVQDVDGKSRSAALVEQIGSSPH